MMVYPNFMVRPGRGDGHPARACTGTGGSRGHVQIEPDNCLFIQYLMRLCIFYAKQINALASNGHKVNQQLI